MTRLGQMRDRISLMREEKVQGAGGRLLTLTPIIADVWAEVAAPEGASTEQTGRQSVVQSTRFSTHAEAGYEAARRIGWQGRTYRIAGYRFLDASRRFIEFAAREILP